MKRFYREACPAHIEGGYGITLDGHLVRTPARALLALPNVMLAEEIAVEWRAQGDEIVPLSMPMTGLANAAIDQIAPNAERFAATVLAYGESDLLCYRADKPSELAARQAAVWQPLLDWAANRYGVEFVVTSGVLHVPQAEATLVRLRQIVLAHDPFILAALSTLVGLSGSLVIGLAAIEEAFSVDQLWHAAELEELWQSEQWGEDDQALARRAKRYAEFSVCARFAELARAGRVMSISRSPAQQ